MNPNLNRSLPAYMPGKEALLIIWIEQFLSGLKPLLGLLGIDEEEHNELVTRFGVLKNSYDSHIISHGFGVACTKYKDLGFYDRNHLQAYSPREEENLAPSSSAQRGGYVWDLVDLIEQRILPNPKYTVDIGNQLQIIAPTPVPPLPGDLVAVTEIACDGAQLKIHTPLTKPADSQAIYVDKHDGKGLQFVNVSTHAYFQYQTEPLPDVETIWTFKVALRVREQEVGTAAYVNILVKRT